MRRRIRGEVEQYLNEFFEEHSLPFDFDLVRINDVWNFVKSDFKGVRDLRSRVIEWLKGAGAQQQGRYTKQDGTGRSSMTLWSLRAHESWAQTGPAGRADAWLAFQGSAAGRAEEGRIGKERRRTFRSRWTPVP